MCGGTGARKGGAGGLDACRQHTSEKLLAAMIELEKSTPIRLAMLNVAPGQSAERKLMGPVASSPLKVAASKCAPLHSTLSKVQLMNSHSLNVAPVMNAPVKSTSSNVAPVKRACSRLAPRKVTW